MDALTIEKLCRFIPPDRVNKSKNRYWAIRPSEDADPELDRFLMAYRDLGFGWHFVKTLVDNGLEFPECGFDTNDRFLWRAYLYLVDKSRYRDKAILEALALTRDDMISGHKRAVINAMLVSEDVTFESIAKMLKKSISAEGVEAYATCFFDIPGRKSDLSLLASLVYPNGRYAEFVRDSLDNEAFATLLLRAGYNNGVDDVLAMAGVRTDFVGRSQSADAAKRLESLFMSVGYLLARNGGITSTSPALTNARGLLTAAKQAGISNGASPFTASMGQAMMDDLTAMAAGFSADMSAGVLFGGNNSGVSISDLSAVHTLVTGGDRRDK